jgi:hypothetical protein
MNAAEILTDTTKEPESTTAPAAVHWLANPTPADSGPTQAELWAAEPQWEGKPEWLESRSIKS